MGAFKDLRLFKTDQHPPVGYLILPTSKKDITKKYRGFHIFQNLPLAIPSSSISSLRILGLQWKIQLPAGNCNILLHLLENEKDEDNKGDTTNIATDSVDDDSRVLQHCNTPRWHNCPPTHTDRGSLSTQNFLPAIFVGFFFSAGPIFLLTSSMSCCVCFN